MKNTNTLIDAITSMFTAALESRLTDRKVNDTAKVQQKGAGKAAAFVAEVLAAAKDRPVFNAYMMVAVRHENLRSSLMAAHDWKVANMSTDVKAQYDDTMSSVGCASMLQQLMNSAVWSERRALNNQPLDEKAVAEIDWSSPDGIAVPSSEDQHYDAEQRLQKLASSLLAMQSHLMRNSNLSIDPLVLFSVDERVQTASGFEWVRKAYADTFEDALTLMGETIEQLRTEEAAAVAEQAATFDYAAA